MYDLSIYLIVLLFLMAFVIVFLIMRIVYNKSIKAKHSVDQNSSFTNKEYNNFCSLSESALDNTTISFEGKKEQKSSYKNYDNTIKYGNSFLDNEAFKVSAVGDI